MRTILFIITLTLVSLGAEDTVIVDKTYRAYRTDGGKEVLLKFGNELPLNATVRVAKNGKLEIIYNKKAYTAQKGGSYAVSEILTGGKKLASFKDKDNSKTAGSRALEAEKKKAAEKKKRAEERRKKFQNAEKENSE